MTMKRFASYGTIGILIYLLVACSPAATAVPQTPEPVPSATVVPPTPKPDPLLFFKKGPYHVGKRPLSFNDASRDGRYVSITVWYPAIKPADSTSNLPTLDAAPDTSSEPYPLILSDTKSAKRFAPYVVSHGFVWASVDNIDTYDHVNTEMIDQPLDILFTLDQVASSPPEGLEGMIDSEQVGVTGFSFGGYNALALSGARIDPGYHLSHCPGPDHSTDDILSKLSTFGCDPADAWDEFAAKAGKAITTSDDGLWQPITDERIRAVAPMAGGVWWLFGEKGPASTDRPTLLIVGTDDPGYLEEVLIYEHLGTPDKVLISFIGDGHMVMVEDYDHIARISHFITAFFGYHLQGHHDYAEYFSEDFVAQYDDLFWGIYEK